MASKAHARWRALFAAGCLLLAGEVAAVEFVPLGFLDDRFRQSWANGVSGDGRVVVGESGRRAFRWTAEEGMVGLGDVGLESRANAASFDGSIIVGEVEAQNGAFRWTKEEGMVALPNGDAAVDISADGMVIVGSGGFEQRSNKAVLWTQDDGFVLLPDPDECCWDSVRPTAISADGSVVVGNAWITSSYWTYRWIDGVGADIFENPNLSLLVQNTSGNGSIIVGIVQRDGGDGEAFRWTESEGLVVMTAPPGMDTSHALATSADGETIAGSIGRYEDPFYWENLEAAVWDEVRGWRRVEEILTRGGVDLMGWHLSAAFDISADRRLVVGRGINPDGNTEAWMAVVPEPSTLLISVPLVAAGMCVVRKAGRARR